jgi:hypothetical protein
MCGIGLKNKRKLTFKKIFLIIYMMLNGKDWNPFNQYLKSNKGQSEFVHSSTVNESPVLAF